MRIKQKYLEDIVNRVVCYDSHDLENNGNGTINYTILSNLFHIFEDTGYYTISKWFCFRYYRRYINIENVINMRYLICG